MAQAESGTVGKGVGAGPSALTQARFAAGLTREKLSEVAGICPAALSELEHGRSKPSRDSAEALAAALGVTVAELFPGGIDPRLRIRGRPPQHRSAEPAGMVPAGA